MPLPDSAFTFGLASADEDVGRAAAHLPSIFAPLMIACRQPPHLLSPSRTS